MKKVTFLKVEIFCFLMNWASNFAHPVTPAFFKSLGFASSMFGISFAAMSITYLLFSPLWGKMADKYKSSPIMAICLIGYGLAQLFFGMVRSEAWLIPVRLMGGAFTSGYAVIVMAYCGNLGDEITRPRYMSIHGAVTAVAAAAGYLTGGLLGTWSVAWVFRLQAAVLFALAACVLLFLGEPEKVGAPAAAVEEKSPGLHPGKLGPMLLLLLIGTVLGSFATTGYENAFNYYITDIFAFPTSYNGLIKAITGLSGFAANMVLQNLLRKGHKGGPLLVIVLIVNVALLGVSLFMGSMIPYLIANVIFTAFNAMIQPLQQSLISSGNAGRMGRISGLFFSARSLGMIGGSLFAGLIYEVSPQLPFICTALVLAVTAVTAWLWVARDRKAHPTAAR